MKKEGIIAIGGFIGFIFGLVFYSKVLDKPERQYIIKRLKMKKGAGNIMDVSMGEVPLDVISGDMKRKEVIEKWKILKKNLQTNKK